MPYGCGRWPPVQLGGPGSHRARPVLRSSADAAPCAYGVSAIRVWPAASPSASAANCGTTTSTAPGIRSARSALPSIRRAVERPSPGSGGQTAGRRRLSRHRRTLGLPVPAPVRPRQLPWPLCVLSLPGGRRASRRWTRRTASSSSGVVAGGERRGGLRAGTRHGRRCSLRSDVQEGDGFRPVPLRCPAVLTGRAAMSATAEGARRFGSSGPCRDRR